MTTRLWRGIFTCTTGKATWLARDFFADDPALALAHAQYVAAWEAREWGPLRLVKVVPISAREVVDTESWRPIDPPRRPSWASGQGRAR